MNRDLFNWDSGKSAGISDHGELEGLGDDDHSQYLNEARHDKTTRHALGSVVPHDDHGALAGLSDNDHPQYNEGYRIKETLIFETSTTFEKADYPWLRAVRVRLVGGGGGGDGSKPAEGGGGGGGGACYAEAFIVSDDLADSETITIGAGGAGGGVGNTTGDDGGTTSFGTLVTAEGGKASANTYKPGGLGGTVGTGGLVISGDCGAATHRSGTWTHGGVGGGSHLGGGGLAGYYMGSGLNGADGNGYGGGGGGGCGVSAARSGGAGANGVVIVELYA